MEGVQEILDEAHKVAAKRKSIQPHVIFKADDIDFRNVIELRRSVVADMHVGQMERMLKIGLVLFLVQTEFVPDGHVVCAYFARLKSK